MMAWAAESVPAAPIDWRSPTTHAPALVIIKKNDDDNDDANDDDDAPLAAVSHSRNPNSRASKVFKKMRKQLK